MPARWCRATTPTLEPDGASTTHSSFARSLVEWSTSHHRTARRSTRPSSWPASSRGFPVDDARAVGQLELDLDREHGLPVERLLRDLGREPAGVLEDEPDPVGALADRLGLERPDLEPRRDEREEEREVGVRAHLLLEPRERRVVPEADEIPAPELDRAELRMLERVPVDVALAELVRELQQREVVLGRVLADPVDEVVVGEAGGALRAPELRHPRVDAEEVVDPVDVAAADDHLRVVLEVVEDRDRRVAGEARRLLAHELERAEVGRREVLVRARGVRAEMDAGEGVVADVARDVRAGPRSPRRARAPPARTPGTGPRRAARPRAPSRRASSGSGRALRTRARSRRSRRPSSGSCPRGRRGRTRPRRRPGGARRAAADRPDATSSDRSGRAAASSGRGRRRPRPRDGARPAARRADTGGRSSAGSGRRRVPRRRRPG